MRLHYIPLFISFVAFAKGDLPPGVQCPRLPSFSEALGFHINIAAGDVENAVRPAPVSEAGSPPPPAKAGPNWPTVLESAGFHLDIAARDVSRWLTQAGEDIARELGSVDIGDSQRFFRTAADRRGAPAAPLPGLLENPGLHLSIAAGDVGQGLERLFRAAALWTDEANANLQRDPGRTVLKAALDGARAGLLFVPGMLWGPVLNVLGFSIGGVVPGESLPPPRSLPHFRGGVC